MWIIYWEFTLGDFCVPLNAWICKLIGRNKLFIWWAHQQYNNLLNQKTNHNDWIHLALLFNFSFRCLNSQKRKEKNTYVQVQIIFFISLALKDMLFLMKVELSLQTSDIKVQFRIFKPTKTSYLHEIHTVTHFIKCQPNAPLFIVLNNT